MTCVGHPLDLRAGSRRQQQRATAFGSAADAQPGGDGDQAGPRDHAQQQRLADLDAVQAPLLDRRRARGDQPARHVQRPAGVARQPEVPEGERVADRRGHHHGDQHEGGDRGDRRRQRRGVEAVDDAADRARALGIEVRLVGEVGEEAHDHADRHDAREREGRIADPARIQHRQLGLGRRGGSARRRQTAPAPARGGAAAPRAGRAASASVSPSSRTAPPRSRSERPVPISTRASPRSRCIARAVTSTVRTRSRDTASTRRRSRPVLTSTRSSVTR